MGRRGTTWDDTRSLDVARNKELREIRIRSLGFCGEGVVGGFG